MKPIVCGDDLPIYVPTEGCSDCDVALARIANLMADDIGVDPTRLEFFDGSSFVVHNIQDNLDRLKYAIDSTQSGVRDLDSNKQETLVSGVNIKTINDTSLLGNGNIVISGGGGSITIDTDLDTTSSNAVENRAIANAIQSKQDAIYPGDGIEISGSTVSTTLADYYCARVSTTTTTSSGTSKVMPLALHKGHGQVFSVSGNELTCNVAGTYEVSASIMWTPDSSGATCPVDLSLDVGGNTLTSRGISTGGVAVSVVISPIPISLDVGDTVNMSVTATNKPGGVAGGFRYSRIMLRRLI